MSTRSDSILLLSPDRDLHRSIQEAARLADSCDCLWIDNWTTAVEDVIDTDPSLVILHTASSRHAEEFVVPFAEVLLSKCPPIPVLAVFEEFDGRIYKQLLQRGVRDCFSRPVDVPRVAFFIGSELVRNRLTNTSMRASVARTAEDPYELVLTKATRVALTNSTVLLTGETGVGKTHLAKLIHEHSPRARFPFVNLNCASLAENLAESALFGHKKGSFTGAGEDYEGYFAASGKGTLFLDEIDSLSLTVQGKLLRSLDDLIYEPVGSVQQQILQSRLIAASNISLEEAVERGKFRRDLYYRLKVVDLHVPPLRHRVTQIAEIGQMLLREICERRGVEVPHIAPETWLLLKSHDWPGNLRELRNVLEHATLFMSGHMMYPDDLPATLFCNNAANGSSGLSGEDPDKGTEIHARETPNVERRRREKQKVMEALRRCNQNKSQAARELGISRYGLYKKLRCFGLPL